MGLFASQLASIPHAHAGNSTEEQQKHDATPHFHCRSLGQDHHESDHSQGRHSHQDDGHSEPAKNSHHQPLSDGLRDAGHDATAVYCPGNATSASVGQQHGSYLWLLSGLGILAICQSLQPELSCGPFGWGRPPDKVLDDSNIYLTLRHLRI